ncbi:MAG: YvcK family protein [Armatimonadetes bacterium]|nr:YvcK family protein [Armatimonadota bacterium]
MRVVKPFLSSLKWLYPGMRVKRWLLLVPFGVAAVIAGVVLLLNMHIVDVIGYVGTEGFKRFGWRLDRPATQLPVGIGLITLGLILIFISLRQVVRSITSVVSPEAQGKLADMVFQKRYLSQGQRIVVIGGGTGLSTMLRGLKRFSSNIVAVVTVTDDGGSSGLLQREMGMLPPGDIRNCLVALADSEHLMTELFQYRFCDDAHGLNGHSFGNLLIAAMTRITGDFERAVKETSNILAIRGRVLPSTIDNVRLQAELEDGTLAEGETSIVKSPGAVKHVMLCPSTVKPLEETLKSIELADCIVIGPGSVYTSIVPNLLVHGIPEAIHASDGMKVYVCNVMTQPGETDGYTASDHVKAVIKHTEHRVFQYVLVNSAQPSKELLEKYAEQGQYFVEPDAAAIRDLGFRPIVGDFISQTDVVRHDPDKLADAIMKLVY